MPTIGCGWPCPGYPYSTGGFITTEWTGTSGSDGTNVYGNYNAWSSFPNYWTGPGTWTGTVTAHTPEPTSLLLLGTGLLGVGRLVLRRKRGV